MAEVEKAAADWLASPGGKADVPCLRRGDFAAWAAWAIERAATLADKAGSCSEAHNAGHDCDTGTELAAAIRRLGGGEGKHD